MSGTAASARGRPSSTAAGGDPSGTAAARGKPRGTAAGGEPSDIAPVLPVSVLEPLAECVRGHYGSAPVAQVLGLPGQAALARADLLGAERLTQGGSPTETLIRLFLLGLPVSRPAAAAALAPLPVQAAVGAGLLIADGDQLLAALDLRPYSEIDGPDWWLLSDLGADVRPGPLRPDHVLGVGQAATTLAQATVREPVRRALDVGTGSGVQALHLSRHCRSITATDLSDRALSFAAANAALNGQHWQLRQGSLLDPVAGELFDLIVCNPPFIVGPGFTAADSGFSYRDSGLAGDSVCQRLVAGLPDRLAEHGTGQLLANWIIPADVDWSERVAGWLPPHGVAAWIWQREVAEPGEYVSLWLRDAGERPGTERWAIRYRRWQDWFTEAGAVAVGMGLISIRRTDRPSEIVCEDVPQAYQSPVAPAIADWFDRRRWLADADLLAARLVAAPGLVLTTRSLLGEAAEPGWQPALSTLGQTGGLRWEIEVDEAVAMLVAACTGEVATGAVLSLLAESAGLPATEVIEALRPVLRDLVERGFLLPNPPAGR
ncbi:MAG: methyltransferase [Jatrophihabitantaceae bacterium]